VSFPVSRMLPDPIRQVDVVQADTGQMVSNAEVVIYADRFTNWIRSFPPRYAVTYTPPAETSIIVPLKQEPKGKFTTGRLRVSRYVRPWGIGPLGTAIHEDYTLTISVRAVGYNPVTATYCPTGGFAPLHSELAASGDVSLPRLGTNGTMEICLRRNRTDQDAAAKQILPVRLATIRTPADAGSSRSLSR
jgi:hypothetical protein